MKDDLEDSALAVISGSLSRCSDENGSHWLPDTTELSCFKEMVRVDVEEGLPPPSGSEQPPAPHSFYYWIKVSVLLSLLLTVAWFVLFDRFGFGTLPKGEGGIVTQISETEAKKLPTDVQDALTKVKNLRREGKLTELCNCLWVMTADHAKLHSSAWMPVWGACVDVVYKQNNFDLLKRICRSIVENNPDDIPANFYLRKVDIEEVKKKIDGGPSRKDKEKLKVSLDYIKEECVKRLASIESMPISAFNNQASDLFKLILSDVAFQKWRLMGCDREANELSEALKILSEVKTRSKEVVKQEIQIWTAVYKTYGLLSPFTKHQYMINGESMNKDTIQKKIDDLKKEMK